MNPMEKIYIYCVIIWTLYLQMEQAHWKKSLVRNITACCFDGIHDIPIFDESLNCRYGKDLKQLELNLNCMLRKNTNKSWKILITALKKLLYQDWFKWSMPVLTERNYIIEIQWCC